MSDSHDNSAMPPPLAVEQAAAGLTNAGPWQRLLAAGLWPAAKPQQLLVVITGLFSLVGITTAAVVGYKLASGTSDRAEIERPEAGPRVPSLSKAASSEEQLDGTPGPFEDIRQRGGRLPLPKRDFGFGQSGTGTVELAEVAVDRPQECRLSILGSEEVLGDGRTFTVEAADDSGRSRTWEIRSTASMFPMPEHVAVFLLEDRSLQFRWIPGVSASARPEHLQYCVLELQAAGRTQRCCLSNPEQADAIKIDPQRRSSAIDLPLEAGQLPGKEHLRLEVQPEGFPACEVVPGEGPEALRSAVIRVFEPDSEENARFLDVAVQLDLADNIGLTVELISHAPQVAETGTPGISRVRTPISMADLEQIRARHAGTAGRYQPALREIEADLEVRTARFREVDAELSRKKGKQANLVGSSVTSEELRKAVEELKARLAVEIDQLEREHQRLSDAVKEKEDEKKKVQALQQVGDQGAAWCDKMATVLEQLRDGAEIRYRVYAEVAGEQVDVLLGQGPPAPDADGFAGPAPDLPGPAPDLPGPAPDTRPPPGESPPQVGGPLADIRRRNFHIPLPKRDFGIGSSSGKEVELAKIFVKSPKSCELSLVGSEEVLDGGMTFVMQREDEGGGRSTWEVRAKTGESLAKGQRIATFTLEDECLKFKWDSKATSTARPGSLQYCLLAIRAGGDEARCVLANPDEVDPVEIGLESHKSTSSLPLGSKSIPRGENLRLDLQLSDFPRSALTKQHGLKVDEPAVIQVFEPDEPGNKRFLDVHVQLSLEPEPGPGLVFAMTSHQKLLTPGTRNVDPSEEPMSLRHLEELRRYCSESRLQRLGTDLKRVDTQIGNLQRSLNGVREKLRQIDQALASLVPPKNATEAEKAAIKGNRGWLQTDRAKLVEAERQYATKLMAAHAEKADTEFPRDFLQGNAVWCDRMAKVFEQLHDESKVQFRIYAEVAGQEVDVLRSKGYPSNKPW